MKLAVTSCAVSAAAPARAAIVAEAIAVGFLPPHRREWNRRPYSAILAGPLTLSVRKNWKKYASLYLLQIDAFAALASSVHLADCRLIVAES